ncbi:unnamed protein product, partial [marine sediment metagenome]
PVLHRVKPSLFATYRVSLILATFTDPNTP